MSERLEAYYERMQEIILKNKVSDGIDRELHDVTSEIDIEQLDIEERVHLSTYVLKLLSREQRIQLAKTLIMEQIVDQRAELAHWGLLTAQSAMIDTGYIAQHLVSLCTQIPGQGMRGKGLDLADGSEVKSANYLDSRDRKGAREPRWNFNSTEDKIKDFLHYNNIYLVSIDYSIEHNYRVRIWKIDVRKHMSLRKRYKEWMKNPSRKSVNFQLFPPRSGDNSIYARHGSGKKGELQAINIPLENVEGAEKIFHAEVVDNDVVVSVFK